MNAKQRMKNRRNAHALERQAREIRNAKHTCENCGQPGGHWVTLRGQSIMAVVLGLDDAVGFWTCAKYYSPDGRRIEG